MATREAIIETIRKSAARGEALRERIIAAPEAALADGQWSVRDALSHLAARANPLSLIEAVSAMLQGEGEAPAFDPDAQNAAQIAERADKSVAEILDEMQAAYEAAIAGIDALDDETLGQGLKLPGMENEIHMSDLVVMSMGMHVDAHLGDIEAALDAAGA